MGKSYPWKDVRAKIIIECLCQLFAIFGILAYIHTGRGRAELVIQPGNGKAEGGYLVKEIARTQDTRAIPVLLLLVLLKRQMRKSKVVAYVVDEVEVVNANPHVDF